MMRKTVLLILLSGLLAGYGVAETSLRREKPIVVMDFVAKRQALNPDDPAALRRHYDEVLLATCLQGLVNRNEPQLFVRYNAAPDDFWFQKMTEAGGWVAGRKIERIGTVADLLKKFPAAAKGLIVWDERVPATMNVAATVAGIKNLLAVRFDESAGSLYQELTSGNDRIKIAQRLLTDDGRPLFTGQGSVPGTTRATTGSSKNDAYIWLIENYIKPGRTNPRMLGYYIDGFWLKCRKASALQNHTLNNLDYLIANRCAIVDLNVWEDESPVDDPVQAPGTDLKTLREVMAACVTGTKTNEIIAVFGFPPWAFKYTDSAGAGGKHGAVATEWKFAEIMTAYNAYMDADALGYSSFPNASFYQHHQVPEVVKQDAEPTREKLIEKGILDQDGKLLQVNYYAHYQGDFDSAAWVYWHFPKIWDDSARGTLPLTWAINPTLAKRFPFGMHYIRKTSKPQEVFVAGEGAGYLNQSLLQAPRPAPHLPDAMDLWVAHSKKWYTQWDVQVTGFNIDGNTPAFNERSFEAYKTFSPGGVGLHQASSAFGMCKGVPFIRMTTDLPGSGGDADMGQTVEAVRNFFRPDITNFLLFRSILQSPSYYAEIQRRLQEPGNLPNKLVDVPTLMWLIREYNNNPEYQQAHKSYANQKTVTATPDTSAGLHRSASGDGVAVIAEEQGVKSWRIDGSGRAYFIYFAVAEDFAKSIGAAGVTVKVTYLDQARGKIEMQYDSRDKAAPASGAYKSAADVITTGSGEWKVAEFVLLDALFSSRQNGSSDFRLNTGGKPLTVRSVEVSIRSNPRESDPASPVFTYPLHTDGGLIYDPLRREAEKTGQLARYADASTVERVVRSGRMEARFQVPVGARAYDTVPVSYILKNTSDTASGPVHVSATAFEEPVRRAGRDLADLSLPADLGVQMDFLGSVTADLRGDPRHLMAADLSDKPAAKYPNYDAKPLVRSGTVEAGDLVWFRFRLTNTGNTILDPEGVGAFFLKPDLSRQKADGTWESTGIAYNRYVRILDYLYPGESTEVWLNFRSSDKETPQGFGLVPGRYRIGINALARFEQEYDWLVNIWEGRTVARAEWDFTAAGEPLATEPEPVRMVLENLGGGPRLNKWLHTFEEFMTAFDSHLAGLPPGGEVRGTLHLQVAPWTKEIVVKLLTGNPPQLATAAAPAAITTETLPVAFRPTAKNLVWKNGRWQPMVATQTMADMRSNIQLGPDVAETLRRDLALMKESGITSVTTTGMPWLYEFIRFPYIHSQPTEVSNQNGDAWKFFLDLARADGMPVEGWGNYPFARMTIGEIASWLTGKPFPLNAAQPMEASHVDPKLPEANALVWLYHYERWGDLFSRNAAGQTPFSVEDTRGWLRMDLHIRYPHGPAFIVRFREWAKAKYSNLENLNTAWDSAYSTWEEIDPERGQISNAWGHHWEYSDSNNPFHDWSPALADFDRFRTEVRVENYERTLSLLREKVPSSALTLRTEGSNVLVAGIDPSSPNPHLRHVYYNQRRNAMIAEILQKSGVLAYHSDYTTLPYTPSEVRELTSAAVKQGVTPAWLPQFDHMRDIALNERYGTDDYQRAFNADRPVKAAMLHVLTAVYPWWQAMAEEGGVPGILWADYECDGFVTATQSCEMKLFKEHLATSTATPDIRKAIEAFPPPPPNPESAAKRSFDNAANP